MNFVAYWAQSGQISIGIGFLSGLMGAGGGIFLSPLLLFLGWSDTRSASGVAAVFIISNSIAGLLGNVTIVRSLPPDLWIYSIAISAGAIVVTFLGVRWQPEIILKALGCVLIIAGLKLIGVYLGRQFECRHGEDREPASFSEDGRTTKTPLHLGSTIFR